MSQKSHLHVESPKGKRSIPLGTHREQRLTDLLRREHLPLNIRCGQRGLCDGCVVELLSGSVVHLKNGGKVHAPATVRACEYRCGDDAEVVIRIPARSLLAHKAQAVSEFRLNVPRAHDPLWKGTLPALGAALDVGTTTVAVVLVDLRDGKIVGRAADFNKQMHFGDDVATRIGLCASDKAMVGQLQEAVVGQTVAPLVADCLRQAGAKVEALVCLSVAGNTTMQHLFIGENPAGMGVYPFRPEFLEHRMTRLPAFGEAEVHLLPGSASYIGGDISAGVFASGLAYDEGPSLLVDVGTNGEIVLKAGGKLIGCATAAGPAFEGAGLTNGIRAAEGAIQEVRFTGVPVRVETDVIGGGEPIGVCGSAYVDFLAEGRRVGLLNAAGRFEVEVGGELLVKVENGYALRVGRSREGREILVSESDLAHLLQSKAAIGAGVLTLLERAGLKPGEIKKVYMAGGFGLHLDIPNAIACGLLPGFEARQVQVVGNTSLAGAYLALVDGGALEEIKRVARGIEIVELNLDPGFESRYIDNLSLC